MTTMTLKIRVNEDTVLLVKERNVIDEDQFISDAEGLLYNYTLKTRDIISIKTETTEHL